MITLKQFIYLLEGKVDDLINQHTDVPVKEYAAYDPTPTKSFLPWLISQHRKGKVKIDTPDLAKILTKLHKYKSPDILDHNNYDFDDIVKKLTINNIKI